MDEHTVVKLETLLKSWKQRLKEKEIKCYEMITEVEFYRCQGEIEALEACIQDLEILMKELGL